MLGGGFLTGSIIHLSAVHVNIGMLHKVAAAVFGGFVHLTAVHIAVYNIIAKGVEKMAIKCKIDILGELKKAGYSTYKLRQEKIMGESLIQRIRSGGVPEIVVIDKLCRLLNCRVEDIIEYESDPL